tara:strand:- start:11568 stop:12290 length:723 start_codon:yes stop_codon:yes gene_type:complete
MKTCLLLAIVALGCSATKYLVPEQDQEGLSIQQTDQFPVITSVKENSTIAIRGSNVSQTMKLFVFIKNQSRDTLEFIQDSVVVYGIMDEKQIKLNTYEPNEYLKVLKQKHKLSNSLSAMEQTIGYANPENITIKTNEDVTESDGLIDVNINTDKENLEVNRAARQQREVEAIKKAEESKNEVMAVGQTLLDDYTLLSNETVFGDVMIKTRKYNKYLLSVQVGEDIHQIYFTLEKNEKQKY